MTLADLNALPPTDRLAALRRCCGALAWAVGLNALFPFEDEATLLKAARQELESLTEDGWREAFSHHPSIGDSDALREKFASTAAQAADEKGAPETLEALRAGNEAYEQKFGYNFIVCTTGKSAAEMLALLAQRLPHTPEQELPVAAAEQQQITRLRLEKLLAA